MYNVTLLRRVYEPKNFITKKYSFADLYRFLTHERPLVPKKQQVAWSPAIFVPGTKKCNEHAIELSLMVIDIDEFYNFEHVSNQLRSLRLQFIMHTSYSHEDFIKEKFRIVLPISEPVPAELWPFYFDGMLEWFRENITIPLMSKYHNNIAGCDPHDMDMDKSVRDPGRAYYTMTHKRFCRSICDDVGGIVDWEPYAERARFAHEAKLNKKLLQAEEERQRREAHLKNLEGRRPSYTDKRKYHYHMLRTQRDWREALAHKLGCTIRFSSGGDRATKFVCPNPACRRTDCTYFYIDPFTNDHRARCGHRNSCGWTGELGYLAEINGWL
jgi:hypothetical protein